MIAAGYALLSKQARSNSTLFACQAGNYINLKGVVCPCYSGRDAPFCFSSLHKI